MRELYLMVWQLHSNLDTAVASLLLEDCARMLRRNIRLMICRHNYPPARRLNSVVHRYLLKAIIVRAGLDGCIC